MWNTYLINSPNSNYSILENAKVREINVYKSTRLGLRPTKSIINTYTLDERASRSIAGFSTTVNFANPPYVIDTTNPNVVMLPTIEELMESFSINQYSVIAPWVYQTKSEEKAYDENGENPVITKTEYFYDNPEHKQLKRKIVDNSDISLTRTEFKYPYDFTDNPVCQEMKQRHQIAPIVQTTVSIKPDDMHDYYPVSELFNVYQEWIGNNGSYYDIGEVKSSNKGEPLQTEGVIYQRDDKGNVIDYETKDKVRNAVLWGYNSQYPIAKISGTDYATLFQAVQGYNYQSQSDESLTNFLRELRNRVPSTSMLTTYNYNPFTGINYQSDPNGVEATFQYDNAGRLVSVFDDKRNLVKRIEYNYVGSQIDNQFSIYFNDEIEMNVRCSECVSGTVGEPGKYRIPAGVYYSEISVEDANSLAKESEKQRAQDWTNQFAKCVNSDLWCTGDRLKKVGCDCDVAKKKCLGIDPNYNGPGHRYRFRYEWTDGTYTSEFTEIHESDPCAAQNN